MTQIQSQNKILTEFQTKINKYSHWLNINYQILKSVERVCFIIKYLQKVSIGIWNQDDFYWKRWENSTKEIQWTLYVLLCKSTWALPNLSSNFKTSNALKKKWMTKENKNWSHHVSTQESCHRSNFEPFSVYFSSYIFWDLWHKVTSFTHVHVYLFFWQIE